MYRIALLSFVRYLPVSLSLSLSEVGCKQLHTVNPGFDRGCPKAILFQVKGLFLGWKPFQPMSTSMSRGERLHATPAAIAQTLLTPP